MINILNAKSRFSRTASLGVAGLCLAAGLLAVASLPAGSARAAAERWTVVCGESACLADYQAPGLQILIAPERGSRRLRAIFRISHQAGANAPIAVQLDSGWKTSLMTSACNHLFCQAAVKLEATDEVLQRFRHDLEGVAAYRVNDGTVVTRFSLKGFTHALSQIQ